MANLNINTNRKKKNRTVFDRAAQNEASIDRNNYIERNGIVILPELESYIRKQDVEEAELFRESIETEGIREPLLLVNIPGHDNLLIDGHHRYKASENSPTVPVKYITSLNTLDEVKVWMLKNQLGRRNLKDFERIELSEKLLSFNAKLGIEKRVQNASKNESANLHFRSEEESASPKKIDHTQNIADTANTSRRNTSKALKIIREAPEELKDLVRSGERSIHSAYQEITKKAKVEKAPKVNLKETSLQEKLNDSSNEITAKGKINTLDNTYLSFKNSLSKGNKELAKTELDNMIHLINELKANL
ncbi:hypothetical protein EI427_25655 (plasmid) [Flammeovirga pectinis]|uniref:ParB-like N-terminal domain-containing protein n=1 Tax=Flammeovirga pectinis TaxID=2494373 RepID=A0A3Q9FQI7_9BACT|nr:ParB/Srx family N-terminal domain-containing protein [Flammeovirga pectinis]AZQ65624.1 hypothetical protein EI427_25655 [Flammeovirga pectinis]